MNRTLSYRVDVVTSLDVPCGYGAAYHGTSKVLALNVYDSLAIGHDSKGRQKEGLGVIMSESVYDNGQILHQIVFSKGFE